MSAVMGRAEVFCVEGSSTSIFCMNEGDAQDVVLAYALRDEVALMSRKTVSAQEISEVDERGRLTLVPVNEYEMV